MDIEQLSPFLLLPKDENQWVVWCLCDSCDKSQVCTMALPKQHPPSWLIPLQSTWEYLHFWHLMLAGLGRDGTILSRWLRINCCTSAGSESRCSLPNITVVWTTTEGPISGDSEIKKRDAFERLLINACRPCMLTIVPLAQESIRMKISVAPSCSSSWKKHKE